MGWYRTVNSLAILLGINIAVRLFNISVCGDALILGNHLVEAAAAFAVVSLLIDLRLLESGIQRKYFKVGLIAFFAGIIMVAASFSSLFVFSEFVSITKSWFQIAPQIIFLIGIPTLYFADQLSVRQKIFGFNNTGKRGLLNVFIIGVIWSIGVIWVLNHYRWLVI